MNTDALYISAVVLLAVMLLGWLWQLRSRNAGIADALWAFGLGGAAIYYAFTGPGAPAPRAAAGILAGLWVGRLGAHIQLRMRRERHEDGRYRALRQKYGSKINLFHVFLFSAQAGAAWLFALPAWVSVHNPDSNRWVLPLAGLIAIIAFGGESLADRQLEGFRADPANRGKTCRRGLWRYTRHPNYFFEWLHWFAWPLLAWGAPYGTFVWLAPVLMFVFLNYFTGIPYTEAQALRSRGEDYRDYQRKTRAFIPWRPRP
jgi:steroid 5-alpha reductase family enzyme